jgi:hypothetical protein
MAHKRIYTLALSIYSHVRHGEYESAKSLVIELLELLTAEIEKTKKANADV